ncbi:hypothetical protein Goe4_c00230 [Bacillus phage vB_BthP-Goe4]|uniref:Uncharacterized protein n=1 Tax=Bacillus phage vB_BthP-Goe4 TaxID=2315470 RepID=A0A386KQR1_9CAUD|nr:hypothetical protein H3015_gp21 [Bacillus phage vB_BthP-Goe4]AYD87732.1 hypothetical protein Goe4_c00230 [Bacillus phage vB_BthP-Goe4]
MTDLKTIIMVMNTLETCYYLKARTDNKIKKELILEDIMRYKMFLGFDENFDELNIKW